VPCDTVSHPQDKTAVAVLSCMAAFGLHPFVCALMYTLLFNTSMSLGRGWEVTSLLLVVPCWCQMECNVKFADMDEA
jgi:hypothetical protein